MVNGMQIYANLPMFKTFFPAYSAVALEQIIDIAGFDLIPFDVLLDAAVERPEDDGKFALDVFTDNDYESYYMIFNMGTLVIIFLITITLPLLIIILLRPCKNRSSKIGQQYRSVSDAMRGNILIRFYLEAALDIEMCIFLQFYYSDYNGGLFATSETFDILNGLLTILFGPLVLILIVALVYFYSKNYERWSDTNFKDRFGTVFEGLRTDTKLVLFYTVIFLGRRAAFCVVAIFFKDYLFVQVLCLLVFSTIALTYLLLVKPFVEPRMQRLEIFNEICTLLLTYNMLCFSEDANLQLFDSVHYYD